MCMCVSVCLCYICGDWSAYTHMWRSEDMFRELRLSFYHVGPRDLTPGIKLGGRHLYPLS